MRLLEHQSGVNYLQNNCDCRAENKILELKKKKKNVVSSFFGTFLKWKAKRENCTTLNFKVVFRLL